MTTGEYDSRQATTRFAVQYPHISGGYAVLDRELGAVVAIGVEEDAIGAAAALNAVMDPGMEEIDVVRALEAVHPAQTYFVAEHLVHLIRRAVQAGEVVPIIDASYLNEVVDAETATRVLAALRTALEPARLESG